MRQRGPPIAPTSTRRRSLAPPAQQGRGSTATSAPRPDPLAKTGAATPAVGADDHRVSCCPAQDREAPRDNRLRRDEVNELKERLASLDGELRRRPCRSPDPPVVVVHGRNARPVARRMRAQESSAALGRCLMPPASRPTTSSIRDSIIQFYRRGHLRYIAAPKRRPALPRVEPVDGAVDVVFLRVPHPASGSNGTGTKTCRERPVVRVVLNSCVAAMHVLLTADWPAVRPG